MLRRLAPLLMAVLVVLAVAVITRKLTSRPGIGLLALPPSARALPGFLLGRGRPLPAPGVHLPSALFGSPTMTFGFRIVLRGAVPNHRGAKRRGNENHMVPAPVSARRHLWRQGDVRAHDGRRSARVGGSRPVHQIAHPDPTGVPRGHVGVWLAFQFGFYAGESTGFRLTPRGTFDFAVESFGAVIPLPLSVAGIALAATIVLLWVVHMAGMLGLLTRARGGTR